MPVVLVDPLSLRLGLRYARGLRENAAGELEAARIRRAFGSIEELARRVPSLSRVDFATFAEVGALNSVGEGSDRRNALWQVQRAGRQAGPLLETLDQDEGQPSLLQAMNPEERMVARLRRYGRHSRPSLNGPLPRPAPQHERLPR